jgi:excisionase family DNA binding protein
MRTVHVEPGTRESISLVLLEIERLLAEGKSVTITVAPSGEWITPAQAAELLGCSRQAVEWLIRTDELDAHLLGDGWQIELESVLDLCARRDSARRRADVLEGLAAHLRAVS